MAAPQRASTHTPEPAAGPEALNTRKQHQDKNLLRPGTALTDISGTGTR